MEKESIKIRLSTIILLIIILGLIGGIVYFVLQNQDLKNNQIQSKIQVQSSQNTVNNGLNEKEDSTKTYNQNFADSVYKQLDKGATIVVPIWAYNNYSEISINSKHEAYWHNEENDTFLETSNNKVAENVINAWYCPLGQDIKSNACLLFLKENRSVTYIRFYIDKDKKGNDFVNVTKEQELKEISGISNVLIIENGFYGVMFIKEDGTAMTLDLTKLDDITNINTTNTITNTKKNGPEVSTTSDKSSIENKILGVWKIDKVLDSTGNETESAIMQGYGPKTIEFKEDGIFIYNIGVTASSDNGSYTISGNTINCGVPSDIKGILNWSTMTYIPKKDVLEQKTDEFGEMETIIYVKAK